MADDDPVTSDLSRMAAPLVFKGVYVTLAKNEILKDVSGVARRGQILAIMGPSGQYIQCFVSLKRAFTQ